MEKLYIAWREGMALEFDVDRTVDTMGLRQMNDTAALELVVDAVLKASTQQLAEYRSGKVQLFGFFVGQCMKESKGQGNPKTFTELLKAKIG